MLDHVCTLKIPDDDKKLSFGERWNLITQISRKTPRAKKYFDSLARIANEKRRHSMLRFWWIIHPFSNWRYLINSERTIKIKKYIKTVF